MGADADVDDDELEKARLEVLAPLKRWFRNRGRTDYVWAANRVLRAAGTTGADALLSRIASVDVAELVLPVLARCAPEADKTHLEGLARQLHHGIERIANNIMAVAYVADVHPPPRRGRDLDLLVIAITADISAVYMRLTGRRPGRSSYGDKRRAYGFQAFLGEMFEALGIEANAEHQARLTATRIRSLAKRSRA